ncbi:MAG TPA: hypothetical protein VFT76_00095 [Actinomycetota bacterium]|nr:hypothetical protein [Actinomycetota bacterium]
MNADTIAMAPSRITVVVEPEDPKADRWRFTVNARDLDLGVEWDAVEGPSSDGYLTFVGRVMRSVKLVAIPKPPFLTQGPQLVVENLGPAEKPKLPDPEVPFA